MSNVFLLYHQCNAWCRPREKVHALAGYGDRPHERDEILETFWGTAVVIDWTPAEAPPDGNGRPATLTILRFITPFDELPDTWDSPAPV